MSVKSAVHSKLPDFLRPVAEYWYYKLSGSQSEEDLHTQFVRDFFDSEQEYYRYVGEFKGGPVAQIMGEAMERYKKLTKSERMGTIGLETARDYYATTRKHQPETVVETGVCNGLSTLSILLAIEKNDSGELYSVDYPHKADESLDEFRKETFQGYGGAAIPSDKEPGWIIPDELRENWSLIVGKSQRELPQLLPELENLELFIHDSEHSYPCMMFEYELAYEWLVPGGVILSDDVTWNDAFKTFVDVRSPNWGRASRNIGYMVKMPPQR